MVILTEFDCPKLFLDVKISAISILTLLSRLFQSVTWVELGQLIVKMKNPNLSKFPQNWMFDLPHSWEQTREQVRFDYTLQGILSTLSHLYGCLIITCLVRFVKFCRNQPIPCPYIDMTFFYLIHFCNDSEHKFPEF